MAKHIGPWIGVQKKNWHVCAVKDCIATAKPHRCPYDGSFHSHGCIHYTAERAAKLGLEMREGWAQLCDDHFKMFYDESSEHRRVVGI